MAVPSVAPSAITGTDSTMVPVPRAGLSPAAAHRPPSRARRRAAPGIRARRLLSRRRGAGREGGCEDVRGGRPGAGWCSRTRLGVNPHPLPPTRDQTLPPQQPPSIHMPETLGVPAAILRAFCRRTLGPRKGRSSQRSHCVSRQTRSPTQACGSVWVAVTLPDY